jgi:hypothetical protein
MNEIANTIIDQLGGNKFLVMTGAKNLVNTPKGVYFKIPGVKPAGAKKQITHIQIYLNDADLYDMSFLNVRGSNTPFLVRSMRGLFASELAEAFSRVTGLATSL